MIGNRILGVILAGGLSRRMGGGDKALLPLAGHRLLDRVVGRLAPQVDALLLNANGDPQRFGLALPVAADPLPDFPGPLAGLLAGFEHARTHAPWARHILTVSADCPLLPPDLAARLLAEKGEAAAAIAASGGRDHPVIGLWDVALAPLLRTLLLDEGERRMRAFTARAGAVSVDWPVEPYDPFLNINTPDDLAAAERLIAAAG
ncbi:molybdopterin-guanine dinucleotide biosynthesis protein A [Ancylobacter sp. 3268]|uniref:molybdenum cofactor guanylyltransferase MobA n=1 Tax=Ancylobacter sp. 3268 TaxID=2817752 RepID=UPI0028640DAE|nr:molybdenum cofactor guanylyltransferase MobA [Ancylobacter sp. 3268]MDR6955565.1 molybdopterin-guanine dinucleotide biosynthesis protein A [Ancylobacter sp. 3268]